MKKLLTILLALSCFFLLTSCIATKRQTSLKQCAVLQQNADKLYKENSFYSARKEYEKIIETCSNSLDAIYKIAIIDLKAGDPEASRNGLHKVLELDSNYAKAYYNLAVIYSSKTANKDLMKAKFAFQKYLELEPTPNTSSSINNWLAKHRDISTNGLVFVRKKPLPPELKAGLDAYELKKYADTIPFLERYLADNPDDIEIRSKLAVCYHRVKDIKRSRNEFLKILGTNDSFQKAYFNLGFLYSIKSDFKNTRKAKFFFTKYLALHPESKEAPKIKKWLKSH